MPVLLIAEPSDVFADAIKIALRNDYEIHTCTDGYAAIERLNILQPDALIINLTMPHLDGLTVLKEAAHVPPVVLALTNLSTGYVQQAAKDAGAGYLMLLPCSVEAVVLQIKQMQHVSQLPQDPQKEVAGILFNLGAPLHRIGCKQLCVAVPLFGQNPTQSLSKELYPAVAEVLGYGDWRSVEYSIRRTIFAAWKCRDTDIWQRYFPHSQKPPSNKHFIAALAEMCKQDTPPGDGRG